jgi:hypothetical protein
MIPERRAQGGGRLLLPLFVAQATPPINARIYSMVGVSCIK